MSQISYKNDFNQVAELARFVKGFANGHLTGTGESEKRSIRASTLKRTKQDEITSFVDHAELEEVLNSKEPQSEIVFNKLLNFLASQNKDLAGDNVSGKFQKIAPHTDNAEELRETANKCKCLNIAKLIG